MKITLCSLGYTKRRVASVARVEATAMRIRFVVMAFGVLFFLTYLVKCIDSRKVYFG